jgi:iron-sulfur cluster assembly accessory protein
MEPETVSADNQAAPLAEPAGPVVLTEKALRMIKVTREDEGMDATYGLRIAVRGGGCSGFEYSLDFDNEPRDTDFVYQQGDVTVYVDAVSARYLEGTQIDYVMGTQGSGFKFNNPRAVGTCGCGSSFTV